MEKDRFDAFMKLADFRLARWNSRKQSEWTISLGLWALLAASIIYLKVRPPELLLIVVLAMILLGHAFLWVGQVSLRNRQDIETAFYYVEHAEAALFPDHPAPRLRPLTVENMSWDQRWLMPLTRDYWSNGFQIVTTAILAVGAYLLIGQ